MLNLLPLSTRLAGPRDAVLHMIIGKNFGCTHFVIGHNHATPGKDSCGNPFYDTPQVRELAQEAGKEIGIEPVFFEEMVYLPFEDEFKLASEVKDGQETLSFTNDHIRDRVRKGKHIPEWASFPEVIKELRRSYPSPVSQGFTVFLTGLSGAGKSTIAKVLYSKFMEIGTRPVTLLDGDIVRRNLSSELNFSKEHRDINVRRIGFVASEITKNRGVAICALSPLMSVHGRKYVHPSKPMADFLKSMWPPPSACAKKGTAKACMPKPRQDCLKALPGWMTHMRNLQTRSCPLTPPI